MTVTCPRGHASDTSDYCDVCGAPIDPPAAAASPSSPSPVPVAGSASSPNGAVTCPSCATENPAGHRFCENCGSDMAAAASAGAPVAAPTSPGVTSAAPTSPGVDPGAPSAAPSPSGVDPGVVTSAPPSLALTPAGGATGWEAVAIADREVYDRVEAPGVAFPLAAPIRRFVLAGDRVAIGRRSASQGIVPEIDLSAAPEDAGVSHHHAVLVAQADGSWAVVDAGSANGTYLNDQDEPIAQNELVPLVEGDRLHVGAWTTITLRRF